MGCILIVEYIVRFYPVIIPTSLGITIPNQHSCEKYQNNIGHIISKEMSSM